MKKTTISFLLGITWTMVVASCSTTDKVQITIQSPEKGSFIEGNSDVTAVVTAPSKTIEVNGTSMKGGKNMAVILPAVNGLGTVKAVIPGDPLFAFRSWLQGTFLTPTAPVPRSIRLLLPDAVLQGDDDGINHIISWLLTDEDLSPWIDNPLQMTVQVMMSQVVVNITVHTAFSDAVSVTLHIEDERLLLSARLENVHGNYTASAVSLNSTGTYHYDWVDITGELVFDAQFQAQLTDIQVETSPIQLADSGALNPYLNTLSSLFDSSIPPAIAQAAANATEDIFNALVSSMGPNVQLTFDTPLTQTNQVDGIQIHENGLEISWATRFAGATAPATAGILERPALDAPDATDLSTAIGSRFFNQLAFAVWAGGNIDRSYTKSQLESMGMQSLDFPYSQLRRVSIKALLPPLLEWDTDGPWIHAGGIELGLEVDGADNAKAWTAAKIPVRLVQVAGGMALDVDDSREYRIEEAGFDKMSKLVDHDKVNRIMASAIPGVIRDLFGALPIASLDSLRIPRFTGNGYFELLPECLGSDTTSHAWALTFSFSGTYID